MEPALFPVRPTGSWSTGFRSPQARWDMTLLSDAADRHNRACPAAPVGGVAFSVGDLVWINSHANSNVVHRSGVVRRMLEAGYIAIELEDKPHPRTAFALPENVELMESVMSTIHRPAPRHCPDPIHPDNDGRPPAVAHQPAARVRVSRVEVNGDQWILYGDYGCVLYRGDYQGCVDWLDANENL